MIYYTTNIYSLRNVFDTIFFTFICSLLFLPARLGYTRDLSLQRQFPKADSANAEAPQEGAGAPTSATTAVTTNFELRSSLRFGYPRFLRHASTFYWFLNGISICLSSMNPCSSFFAVVTIEMSIP